jgi:kynurenine formamidase
MNNGDMSTCGLTPSMHGGNVSTWRKKRTILACVALVAVAATGACDGGNTTDGEIATTAAQVAAGPSIADMFSGDVEIIDLTHALSPTAVAWGSTSPFEYEALSTQPSGLVSMGAYSTPEHHGTHIDAPIHGGDNQPTVDLLTAADLFGPAAVIDVTAQSAADPDYAVSRQDILDWEGRHGELPAGAIVIMKSGWSEKYDDADAYRNPDDDGRMHFPGFSEEAARLLIDERDIRGIGVDTLSVDPGTGRGFAAHGVVNGNGKFHLENVANVHLLPESGAFLIVAPIKIKGGSGGQVRIFAVIP